MKQMKKDIRKSFRIILIFMVILGVIIQQPISVRAEKETDVDFVVGFDAEFPPYGYKDENGEYVGFDLDLAAEVAVRKGWNLIKQPINWDSKDEELNTGMIDCIWNGFTINGREDKYTWSVPYVDNSQVVVVKTDSDILKLEDLKGRVVAVQNDSSALAAFTGEGATEENIALAAEFKELQRIGDYNSAFMNLEAGMVDAICMDIGVAMYQLEARSSQFRMLEEQVSTEQYAIGFKLGNESLRDEVQSTLQEIYGDGTFDEIAEKWGLSDCVCLDNYFGDGAVGEQTGETQEQEEEKKEEGKVSAIGKYAKELLAGSIASIEIFLFTILFSIPLGLLVMFVRRSKFKLLQWLAKIYISIMRGTPLMLQLWVVFFGPHYLSKAISGILNVCFGYDGFTGIQVTSEYRFYAVIIGFSVNYAAYFAEIFRAGIEAVPIGQTEAAKVLGYSRTQIFSRIVLPQMVKRVMPPVTNEIITLVKDTSLAFAIAYTEMFTIAKQTAAASASIMPIVVAGVFYYIFNFVVAFVMSKIEKKMSYFS